MIDIPQMANPPIVELIIGLQFSPLTKLNSGHFGIFWKQLGENWPYARDAVPLEDQFEVFETPSQQSSTGLRLRLEGPPVVGRFLIQNKNKDRSIQLQPSRFILNWRKREGAYPSYQNLLLEFDNLWERFTAFVNSEKLGPLLPNQWELTYVNAFPQGEAWQTPRDWHRILPALFPPHFDCDDNLLKLEERVAYWTYEIPPQRGRLYIAANRGRVIENQKDVLLLKMTARGPVSKPNDPNPKKNFELGHEIILKTFMSVTDWKLFQ